jgi:hypothetical protein
VPLLFAFVQSIVENRVEIDVFVCSSGSKSESLWNQQRLACDFLMPYMLLSMTGFFARTHEGITSEKLEAELKKICLQRLNELATAGMMTIDADSFLITSTVCGGYKQRILVFRVSYGANVNAFLFFSLMSKVIFRRIFLHSQFCCAPI